MQTRSVRPAGALQVDADGLRLPREVDTSDPRVGPARALQVDARVLRQPRLYAPLRIASRGSLDCKNVQEDKEYVSLILVLSTLRGTIFPLL